ncbi:bifunctional alpha/beta hydrolase/OsmC family protein [Devosia rhodophyticola]|uniref:Bifunctional alpha/beta hydrolase/OsmC family protein n=1 Tax=Devosia rhodophyticola TaxID=3026423 RepID=A0ABY7YYG5_9HYPH|nr:bifunctional alpha/beta hydrolase/OsmC family protein [Devosia rhodophyticola]WDR06371.1 bifunctional alpha/beta hydrolase/OsmC family protein [Devosia rhodophyticola]
MPTEEFSFINAKGEQLSGRLETSDTPARSYAVFAHCFTCDKTSLAATRISRRLAEKGIGVLRFDFTGLGDSEGEFGNGLSCDRTDIIAAAESMAASGRKVELLVGHSFGGAAVLSAAASIPGVTAVAVLAAPFDPEHVLTHVETDTEHDGEGRVPVNIGGRAFELAPDFASELARYEPEVEIAKLGKALLILHAPTDAVVSIGNATRIYTSARHPKSFISLDDADHLLTRRRDAEYAADCLSAWATRYLEAPATATKPQLPNGDGVVVTETGAGKFQVHVATASGSFMADEPVSVGGMASGPTPYGLVSAGLGACTVMTLRLYADRKSLPITAIRAEVTHNGKGADGRDEFDRQISYDGKLSTDQHESVMRIADKCPVHRTLEASSAVVTHSVVELSPAPDTASQHAEAMDEACRQNS